MMWYEVAITSLIFAVGNILFGHFEEQTPKWRKLLKLVFFISISILISYFFGRKGFHIFLGISMIFPLVIHLWWLPKKGINGWTGEPKDKYYELRGWKKKG
ncbi:MAG: hypothetical protein EPO57_01595 [Chitinophagaceae bacterium]|nr:MAG: hypothetical protein EPO57_01595 [Chitinophagaceae bacterium]